MSGLPKSVRIRELGPREGFQTLRTVFATERKLEIISALNLSGVKEIELTSFVRADKLPQMADAEQIVAGYERKAGIRYTALYLNPQGFRRAQQTGRLDNQAWLYIAGSETFLRKNNGCGINDILNAIPDWLSAFSEYALEPHGLMFSCAFGCNYEGEISQQKVLQIFEQVLNKLAEHGKSLQELCLADTVGMAHPNAVRSLVETLRQKYPKLYLSLHLHDTRGTGMANVYAGLLEGIDCFDASVGGMGGCPFAKGSAGNVASEDVAYLCESLGVSSGLDLDAYARAAKLAESIVGAALPGRYYKSVAHHK